MSTFLAKNSSNTYPIFLLVIGIFCCTPILNRPYFYFVFWAVGLFYAIYHMGSKIYRYYSGLVFCSLSIIVICLVYRLLDVSTASWGRYLTYLFFYLLFVILLPLGKISQKQAKYIWWTLSIVFALNILDNIRLSILYPDINIARKYLDKDFLSSINAGTGSFYTFCLFFFCVCFFVFLNCKKKKVKYFMLGSALLTSVYIIAFCFKASVVVYFIFALFFLIYAKRTTKISSFIMIVIATGGLALFLIGIYEDEIIKYIISISPSERLSMRLVTLIDINSDEAHEATITGRTNLYLLSVKTWLSSPDNFIFGIGDHWSEFDPELTGIGQHSDFLDILGQYGIIGGMLIFVILKQSFKFVLSFFEKTYWNQIKTILFIFILCGFTKRVFVPVEFVVFLLLPLSSLFLNKKTQLY